MKNQTNVNRQTLLLATIAIVFLFGAFSSTFAQSVGAKYGTREPRTCADTKAPARGAISAALATKYAICAAEGTFSDLLYLVEDLAAVQVGGSRPYNPRLDSVEDIDVTAAVYPFRAGSYKSYQCAAVTANNKGYNCAIYYYPNSTGACRKTTFGDWKCEFDFQSVDGLKKEFDMPPPSGTRAVSDTKDKPKTPAKTDEQPAAAKAGANENKTEGDLPPPDFSEMAKYFDISKINYDAAEGKLYFTGKMRQAVYGNFQIDFYDADDIKIISTNYIILESGEHSAVGDVAKYFAYLPDESKRKFVKRVVVTRAAH